MASGGAIIEITLDSDEEDTVSGQANNWGSMRVGAATSRTGYLAPPPKLVRGIYPPTPSRPGGLNASMVGLAKRFPKRPGVFPPFALFVQERRDAVREGRTDMSFGDSGKAMGEVWHSLTDAEKEDFRARAKQITEQKLHDWHEKLRALTPAQQAAVHRFQQNPAAAGDPRPPPAKKRRTNAYSLFSAETRKKLGETTSNLGEMNRIVAERWRNIDPIDRRRYEIRAAYSNQQQQRKAMQMQAQRTQQQQGNMNLRIASVSSLQPSTPPVNLPSSITISRVAANKVIPTPVSSIQQRLPPGTQLTTSRGAPVNASPPARRPVQNGVQKRKFSPGAFPPIQPRLQQRQGQRPAYRQGPGYRLPLPDQLIPSNNFGTQRPIIPSQTLPQTRRAPPPRMRLCRVCSQNSPANIKVCDRKDLIDALKKVVNLEIDVEHEKEMGYPGFICRKCTALVLTCEKFITTVQAGQKKIDDIIKLRQAERERKEKQLQLEQEQIQISEPTSLAEPIAEENGQTHQAEDDGQVLSILPDLDDSHHIPLSIKQEKVATSSGVKTENKDDPLTDDNVSQRDQTQENQEPFLDGEVVEEPGPEHSSLYASEAVDGSGNGEDKEVSHDQNETDNLALESWSEAANGEEPRHDGAEQESQTEGQVTNEDAHDEPNDDLEPDYSNGQEENSEEINEDDGGYMEGVSMELDPSGQSETGVQEESGITEQENSFMHGLESAEQSDKQQQVVLPDADAGEPAVVDDDPSTQEDLLPFAESHEGQGDEVIAEEPVVEEIEMT